jgi:hypothetical protein
MTVLIESENSRELLNAIEVSVDLKEKRVKIYIFESSHAKIYWSDSFQKIIVFDGGQKIYEIFNGDLY